LTVIASVAKQSRRRPGLARRLRLLATTERARPINE
jgi:hypothetical protein